MERMMNTPEYAALCEVKEILDDESIVDVNQCLDRIEEVVVYALAARSATDSTSSQSSEDRGIGSEGGTANPRAGNGIDADPPRSTDERGSSDA